jgi:hypothetical protein
MRGTARGTLVGALGVLIACAVLVPASATATTAHRYMFAGHGYVTSVSGGGLNAGKTANVVMWCRTKPGIHHQNSVASVDVPGALTAGEAASRVDGTYLAKGAGKKAQTTTSVQNLSILGGLITVDQLKAVSTTTHTVAGFTLSDAGAVWGAITLDGQPLPLPSQVPDPNTRVDIPAVGYMILNEQTKTTTSKKAVLAVNMLHIHVTQDNPVVGAKNGMNIIVGHAASGLVDTSGPIGGKAFTSRLSAAGALSSGPTAVAYLPCAGTGGEKRTNTLSSVSLPSVLGIGAGKNQTSGVVRPASASADAVSSASAIRLLGGLISADSLNAHVHAVRRNGHRVFKDRSTGFVNLVVNGQPIAADAPANTKVPVPGVGTLVVHRVHRTKYGIEVTMLELKVLQAAQGLPAGAVLKIASAWVALY